VLYIEADLGVQGKEQNEIPDDTSKEPLGSKCHRGWWQSHWNPFLFLLNPNIFNSYLFCNLNFFSLSDIFLRNINFAGEKDVKYPFYHVSLFFLIFGKVSLSPLLPSLQPCKAIELSCSLFLVYIFTLQNFWKKRNVFEVKMPVLGYDVYTIIHYPY